VRFSVLTLPNAPWDELRRRWRLLDDLPRVETIWVADHLANPYRHEEEWFDGWVALTELARTTERARIGPLVSPITFHNAAALTKAAVSLDRLSGGRLDLGLGAGGSPYDHELAGVERWAGGERVRRLRTFVERVRDVEEGTEPKALRGSLPLTIGGIAAATIGLAAEHADRWNSWGGRNLVTSEDAAAAVRRQLELLDAACAKSGRSVVRSLLMWPDWLAERPFSSEAAFRESVERWAAVGLDELVFYYPPELGVREPERNVEPGLFERMLA
jgi:alkanesulfonate monooxygenase SsuD/methylene tetrahydromethanopterin reductase-like flavin-dependent oxidoreductase (luciferase family)